MADTRDRSSTEDLTLARLGDMGFSDVHKATPEERRGTRPTGQEIFDGQTKEEQDAQYGERVAQALRDGTITLADLAHHQGGFLVTKPEQDVLPPD